MRSRRTITDWRFHGVCFPHEHGYTRPVIRMTTPSGQLREVVLTQKELARLVAQGAQVLERLVKQNGE